MIKFLQNWKNAHQLEILIVCIVIILIIGIKLKQKKVEMLFYRYSLIVSNIYVFAILYVTVFSRKIGEVTDYNHEIFWSYRLALSNTGYLEQISLNILLFVPLGFLWAGLIKESKKYLYIIVVLTGGLISGCIEFLQYYLKCGFSELDDVISNVLGMMLGVIIWEGIRRKTIENEK